MRAQGHLSQGGGVRLSTAGGGQVALTPSGEDWLIVLTRVNTTDPTGTFVDEPTVVTYRSAVSDANQIDSTYSGFSATSDTRVLIQSGESLIAEWEGGPSLGYATLRVEGLTAPAGQGIALYGGGA